MPSAPGETREPSSRLSGTILFNFITAFETETNSQGVIDAGFYSNDVTSIHLHRAAVIASSLSSSSDKDSGVPLSWRKAGPHEWSRVASFISPPTNNNDDNDDSINTALSRVAIAGVFSLLRAPPHTDALRLCYRALLRAADVTTLNATGALSRAQFDACLLPWEILISGDAASRALARQDKALLLSSSTSNNSNTKYNSGLLLARGGAELAALGTAALSPEIRSWQGGAAGNPDDALLFTLVARSPERRSSDAIGMRNSLWCAFSEETHVPTIRAMSCARLIRALAFDPRGLRVMEAKLAVLRNEEMKAKVPFALRIDAENDIDWRNTILTALQPDMMI